MIRLLLTAALAAMLGVMTGCAGPSATGAAPTSAQQAVTSATLSYSALDSAIIAADSAVKAGTLKGNDARNALKGLTDAKAALDVSLVALRAANAAAAASAGGK